MNKSFKAGAALVSLKRLAIAALAIFALIWSILRFSPYPELKSFLARPDSVRYYDRNGILLQITALEGGLRREKPSSLSPVLKEVFVFAEDRRFYSHSGVDSLAILRALYQNIAGRRRVSGASTITMQLARLINTEAQKEIVPGGRGRELGKKIT